MRFLVDASCDARLATHLRDQGHDVKRIGRDAPGDLPDQAVLELAHREQRILITDDRDFGDLVHRHRHPHSGVIYLRLETTLLAVRIARLEAVLASHHDQLDRFLVVGPDDIRVGSAR